MKKFIIVYKGEATDPSAMSEEDRNAVMAKWGEWMQKNASAITDIGAPMGESASVVDDGSAGTTTPLSGYSIVQAEDMAGAKTICQGHPFLSEGKGNFAVDVYELMPVPEM